VSRCGGSSRSTRPATFTSKEIALAFIIYRQETHEFLDEDEKTWTPVLVFAARFTSRDIADAIAERELGPGHDAYVFDDGVDE